jgi:uncharacterized protein
MSVPAAPVAALAEGNGLAGRVAVLEEQVAELRAIVMDLSAQLGLSPPGHPEANDRA